MEIHSMNQSKAYLKSKKFTPSSISVYKSKLKKAIDVLGYTPVKFYSINDPVKLKKLLQDFKRAPEFKNIKDNYRRDIISTFNRHIEAVQMLYDLRPTARRYLKEYLASYEAYLGQAKNKQIAIDSLLTGLVDLFSKSYKAKNVDALLMTFLNLKTKKALTDIHNVAMDLSSKDYNLVVFNHFETTAKVLALKGLIKQLNEEMKIMDDEK